MFRLFIFMILFAVSINSFARQSGGGGSDGGLQGVCEMAGGTWHGSESGNWACCWADWGCYGCISNVCKMTCRTDRCRRANAMSRTKKGETRVKGLAPAGMKAPVIPMMMEKRSGN